MKKIIAIALCLAMVLSLVGCVTASTSTTTTTTEAKAEEPAAAPAAEEAAPAAEEAAEEPAAEEAPAGNKALKLASHNAVVEGNPYRVRYELDIQEAAADAANYGYDVSYNSFVANSDQATEIQQITNSINEGYDIILNNPCATTGLDPVILAAQEAGIYYINSDCAYMSTDVDILNVCTDQEYLGYKTGSYAGEVLPEGAKVVMIAAWDGNQANTDRQRGFERAIAEHNFEVVATGNHDWDTTKSQQIMAEILSSGKQFDGVLVSQCAENALAAFDAAGVDYPGFIGFGDTGAFMHKMVEVNKDGTVLPFIVLSNPPGVGATAFNFALNAIEGKTLKDGVYAEGCEDTHQIWIKSKVCFTDKDLAAGAEVEGMSIPDYAASFEDGDSITFWLTYAEVADMYFN